MDLRADCTDALVQASTGARPEDGGTMRETVSEREESEEDLLDMLRTLRHGAEAWSRTESYKKD